jgi:hypothetical protein
MIRIVLFDLGDTLINSEEQPFPYVFEALEAISGFETESLQPIALGLVSDFFMPTPQKSETKLFQEYVELLKNLNLKKYFEPVKKHVTLSTQAGVNKPHHRIFELAITKLEADASLQDSLFITENSEHIAACKALGMRTLQFNEREVAGTDFSDWSDAPLLVAQILNPTSLKNRERALRLKLSVTEDLELIAMKDQSEDGKVTATVKQWYPLSLPEVYGARSTQATVSTEATLRLDPQGRLIAVERKQPDKEEIDEASDYVKTLEENEQVAHDDQPLAPGQTHRASTGKKGEKRIKRERFSAF